MYRKQNMESSVKPSAKRRRRKKKQTELKSVADKSPHRNLGILKVPIRKEKSKRIKEIKKQCLQSVIQDLCEQRVLIDTNLENYKAQTNDLENRTIDLCDTSADNANSSVLVPPSVEVAPKNQIVIDISKDPPDQNEIIDLTESIVTPLGNCSDTATPEPTVIDITEDETKNKETLKVENDDIFIIGTFSKPSNGNNNVSFIPLRNTKNNFNNLVKCSNKLKKKYMKRLSLCDRTSNNSDSQCGRNILKSKSPIKAKRIGENIYVNSPVTFPSSGLRPIIIDGSNVAFVHSSCKFSCKRLEICINYFKEKGHKVTAFVPQFRIYKSDNPKLLQKLERQGDVVLTPSKKIDGRNIVPYDDRFIVQTAVLKGGVIVSRDNYNDLLKENPAWAETIKYRTLAFTWVDDVLMFPNDPLGEFGPSLEEFLRFH